MAENDRSSNLDVQVVSASPGGLITVNHDGTPMPGPAAPAGGAGPWQPIVMPPQQPSVIVVTVGGQKKETPKSSSEVFKRI